MDLKLLIHLIFLCGLNIIFFFSRLVLNTLVIITILKSTQLRKKLCPFMVMVLSCCDLLSVVTYSSIFLLNFIIWFNENNELLTKLTICWHLLHLPAGLSLCTLMIMCIERYLGVYYSIFHRTSVTKRRLLTLLAILTMTAATLIILSTNNLVMSIAVALSIFMAIFIPPFFFLTINCLRSPEICVDKRQHHQKEKETNYV